MKKSLKSKAEEKFSTGQKQTKDVLQEKDLAEKERHEKRIRLKALRLGKKEPIPSAT